MYAGCFRQTSQRCEIKQPPPSFLLKKRGSANRKTSFQECFPVASKGDIRILREGKPC